MAQISCPVCQFSYAATNITHHICKAHSGVQVSQEAALAVGLVACSCGQVVLNVIALKRHQGIRKCQSGQSQSVAADPVAVQAEPEPPPPRPLDPELDLEFQKLFLPDALPGPVPKIQEIPTGADVTADRSPCPTLSAVTDGAAESKDGHTLPFLPCLIQQQHRFSQNTDSTQDVDDMPGLGLRYCVVFVRQAQRPLSMNSANTVF